MVPVIDVSPLVTGLGDRRLVADEISAACRENGFFYVANHGIDDDLQRRLEEESRRFFAQDVASKMEIAMERGGRAWRGYFPVGGELTSGKPDIKEGIYCGAELADDHPLVKDGTPLHGRNLFPSNLKQDDTGGLQVKSHGGWIPAPPVRGAFLCNIGDMLDRMTGGVYRSTPHRVQNVTRRDRLSFPFFFDPNFNAAIKPIETPDAVRVAADRGERWDHASVHDFEGTYGDYVLRKVSKVFPQLRRTVL